MQMGWQGWCKRAISRKVRRGSFQVPLLEKLRSQLGSGTSIHIKEVGLTARPDPRAKGCLWESGLA